MFPNFTPMKRVIKSDLYRYGGLTKVYKGKRFPGFHFTYYLRKASQYPKISPFGIYYRLIIRKLSYKYGFQIPVHTTIGEGFYINHFGPIVINSAAKIGKNCNLAHNVTIGQTNRGNLKGAPTIGDKVWIGTGAVIVGNIKIGDNVLIAPNSFVNIDVPDHSIVLGNPAKIIPKEHATKGYINYTV